MNKDQIPLILTTAASRYYFTHFTDRSNLPKGTKDPEPSHSVHNIYEKQLHAGMGREQSWKCEAAPLQLAF